MTSEPRRPARDPDLVRSFRHVAMVGVALTAIATLKGGLPAGMAVSSGALLALANVYALEFLLGALLKGTGPHLDLANSPQAAPEAVPAGFDSPSHPLPPRPSASPLAVGLLATAKLLVVFGGTAFLVRGHYVSPGAFAVGLMALPLGLSLSAIASKGTNGRDLC